jgi:CBS domain-containing protein
MDRSVDLISPLTTISAALQRMDQLGADALLVGDDEHLAGIVTRAALTRAGGEDGSEASPLTKFVSRPPVHLHPDHPMDVLFDRWRTAGGVIPVLARDDVTRIEGVVTLDAMTRYLSSPDLGDLNES